MSVREVVQAVEDKSAVGDRSMSVGEVVQAAEDKLSYWK